MLPVIAQTARDHSRAKSKPATALRAGDPLMIELIEPAAESPDINAKYNVNAAGEIKVPRIEMPIQAAGLTHEQLAGILENTYRGAGIFTDPVFRVTPPRGCGSGDIPPSVAVGGEIKSGGRMVPLREGMRLYQAIMTAGGPTEFADMEKVKVFRLNKQTVYNLSRIAPDNSNNPILKDADSVYIPENRDGQPAAPAEKTTQPAIKEQIANPHGSAALLKAGDVVILELQRPASDSPNVSARYTIAADGTLHLPYLKERLQVAGLPLMNLEQSLAKEYRDAGIYAEPEFKASLAPGNAGPGRGVSIDGEVKQPGIVIHVGGGLLLYEALMAAGGFTEFADIRRIKLIRAGKETLCDLRSGGRIDNPELQDGDKISVLRD